MTPADPWLYSPPMKRLVLLFSALSLLACNSEPSPTKEPAAAPPAPAPGFKSYGDAITAKDPVPLATVLKDPTAYKGREVLVNGAVRQACTRKGCWMELAENMDPKGPGCRVTFKDYGFFVPTTSAGAQARVQGIVEVETVKASHVEHMEEEGATFPNKNADGTANEVRLVASAVELKK